ncbi:MAG: CDP-alcohol phosphatidyltransferase family protein [Aeromicrobium sp.]
MSDQAREQWSRAHGDVDPDSSRWISGWLSIVHRLTARLAGRGISPGLVTGAGLLVSAAVPLLAWLGDWWPLLAAVCVVAAGLLDGIDGALARWDGTASRWGGVLDDLVDRCSDLLMISAIALLGAPAGLCVGVGICTMLLESARASARAGGLEGIGVLTVWERPSRLIVAAFATGLCGIVGSSVPGIATGAAAIALALSVAGLLQLVVVLRRTLTADGITPDRSAR